MVELSSSNVLQDSRSCSLTFRQIHKIQTLRTEPQNSSPITFLVLLLVTSASGTFLFVFYFEIQHSALCGDRGGTVKASLELEIVQTMKNKRKIKGRTKGGNLRAGNTKAAPQSRPVESNFCLITAGATETRRDVGRVQETQQELHTEK